MRVIAGEARHLPLKAVPGDSTRPTTDRIKETLFNILHRDLPGTVFVDLFAGSGGIGIEALSRGAAEAWFVDNSAAAVAVINENLRFTRLFPRAKVLRADAAAAVDRLEAKGVRADFIFMDPPYGAGAEPAVLDRLARSSVVTPETVVICETALHRDLSFLEDAGFAVTRVKEYKTNQHVFAVRKGEA